MTTYAIVGNGIAGLSAAEEIRRNDPEGRIVLFGDEGVPSYERISLKLFLKDKKERAQLFLKPPEWYAKNRIEFVGQGVARLAPAERKLFHTGGELSYDSVILCMGAAPNDLTVPGRHLKNIQFLYDLADADSAMAAKGAPHRVVVVGGGVLALETADCFLHLGSQVTLLVRETEFFVRFMDALVNQLAIERFVAAGVTVIFDDEVAEFYGDADGGVRGLRTTKGRELAADLVRLNIGAHSELGVAAGSGIAADHSILVTTRMETTVPGVFAAGDCAAPLNPVTGQHDYVKLWAPAADMGRVAGHNASCPGKIEYRHGVPIGYTFLFDLVYYWVGHIDPVRSGDGFTVCSRFTHEGRHFEKFVLRDGKLVGACLWGGRPIIYTLKRLIDAGTDVSALGDAMLRDDFDWRALAKTLAPPLAITRCPLQMPAVPAPSIPASTRQPGSTP